MEVLKNTFCPYDLSRPKRYVPVLASILVTQIHYPSLCISLQHSKNIRLQDGGHHFESFFTFPEQGEGNISPFLKSVSPYFYPITLNSFPNKMYYYFYYILCLNSSVRCKNQGIYQH
jgi:hypothetical protein